MTGFRPDAHTSHPQDADDCPPSIDPAAGLDIFHIDNLDSPPPNDLEVVYKVRIAETRWLQDAVKVLLDHEIRPYLLDDPRRRLLGVGALWGVSRIRLAVATEDVQRAKEALRAWDAAGAPRIGGHERSLLRAVARSLAIGTPAAGVAVALIPGFRNLAGFVFLAAFLSFVALTIGGSMSWRARMRRLRDDR